MSKIDDETSEEVIRRIEQVNIAKVMTDQSFYDDVFKQMKDTFSSRPWIMCLALYIYRSIYLFLSYLSRKNASLDPVLQAATKERLDNFRFASEIGRMADASGRAWYFEHVRQSNMNKIDATFLAWSGVIQIRRRKISYYRWDHISGYFLMAPLYLLILIAVYICFCDAIPPETRAFQSTIYIAEIIFLFKFYKAMSFDVCKVASKYYVTNSWLGDPTLRC